jgi:hypothetical protein
MTKYCLFAIKGTLSRILRALEKAPEEALPRERETGRER